MNSVVLHCGLGRGHLSGKLYPQHTDSPRGHTVNSDATAVPTPVLLASFWRITADVGQSLPLGTLGFGNPKNGRCSDVNESTSYEGWC